jgi:hypothetical protein
MIVHLGFSGYRTSSPPSYPLSGLCGGVGLEVRYEATSQLDTPTSWRVRSPGSVVALLNGKENCEKLLTNARYARLYAVLPSFPPC